MSHYSNNQQSQNQKNKRNNLNSQSMQDCQNNTGSRGHQNGNPTDCGDQNGENCQKAWERNDSGC